MKNNLIQLELQKNLAILFMNNPPNNLITINFWILYKIKFMKQRKIKQGHC